MGRGAGGGAPRARATTRRPRAAARPTGGRRPRTR